MLVADVYELDRSIGSLSRAQNSCAHILNLQLSWRDLKVMGFERPFGSIGDELPWVGWEHTSQLSPGGDSVALNPCQDLANLSRNF
jgi:hypothetical protein